MGRISKRSIGFALALGLAAGPAMGASLVDELGGEALIQAAKKEGRVVVYTSNILSLSRARQLAFNKRFPEIAVELVRLGGGALHSKIMTEHAAGKLVADVVEYSDRGLIKRAMEQGIVGRYTAPTDGLYPAQTKISGLVYPGSVEVSLIAYNSALVQDPPKSWMDLLDARFRGKIGLVPAELGGVSWMTALFQYQVLGKQSESYWQKLADQKPRFFTSVAALGKAVVNGETPVGLAVDVVSLEDIKQGAPVKMVYPPEGVVVIAFNSAVTAAPKHPNAGKLWLNWTLSREGQEVSVKQIGGLSLRTDIDPPTTAPRTVSTWQASEEDFVKLRDPYTRRWSEIFGYKP